MRHTEILVVAAVFAAVHLATPLIARAIRNPERFESFSGGLAVAYVFLHLLPELDEGHALLGTRIYFVALFGFAAVYAFEYRMTHRDRDAEGAHFALHTTLATVYTALLVFTLGAQLPATLPMTLVFIVSIGMHLSSGDVGSLNRYGDRFRNRGRYILAAAAMAGYALSLFRRPHEAAIDALTALLAGFMLFRVFREELPHLSKAKLRPFFAGMVTFLLLHVLLALGAER